MVDTDTETLTVGDGERELEAVDETVEVKLLLGVTLRVGRRSTVKLWDTLIEGEVLMEVVGEIEDEVDAVDVGVMEADDDADEVRVVEDEGLWLTVVDTVAELLLDSDALSDRVGDTLLVAVEETDNVGVAEGDHVAL